MLRRDLIQFFAVVSRHFLLELVKLLLELQDIRFGQL
jgi:hypothetical protein